MDMDLRKISFVGGAFLAFCLKSTASVAVIFQLVVVVKVKYEEWLDMPCILSGMM